MSENNIITATEIPTTLEQAQALITKAREENTVKAKAAWEEIEAVCAKYNATLSAPMFVIMGTTKLPVSLSVGGLQLSSEIQIMVNG